MPTPTASERSKAYKLRAAQRRGVALDSVDQAWLDAYDERQRNGGVDVGASATERLVHIEERAAAAGTGSAAETAAAAALAREEGRRIDYLTKAGMESLIHACTMYRNMADAMLARTQALEEVHLAMLDSVREQYLARTQAEIDAMQKDDSGGITQALTGALAQRLVGAAAPAPDPKKARKR